MFELRKLPFSSGDVAGLIDEKTINFHYGKHHQTYVNNLNNLIKNSEFSNSCLLEIMQKSSGGIFNNAAQVYNHDFYWDCIAKKSEISDELKEALKENFKDFKAEFLAAAAGQFGSGWCWLVFDEKSQKLEIIATSNAQNPIPQNQIPLLVVDVWEHAYYLDYQNARAAYLEKFYEFINWKFVSEAYEWAKKEGMNSVKFYIDNLHACK